jgi:uncharacterized protein YndB with AHSA1/START domain
MENNKNITVEVRVDLPVDKAWEVWTKPEHITKWNNASEDWHTPRAENDLRTGGRFLSRMESKTSGEGFDFEGTYTDVKPNEHIAYIMDDGRKIEVTFRKTDAGTHIIETFDPEDINSMEMQRNGWQSILDNFKKYAEGLN